MKIRKPVVTLKILDFGKDFTANHDAVFISSFSQPDAKFPIILADLQLFDMFSNIPTAKCRDFPDALAFYNAEINNAGDPVI